MSEVLTVTFGRVFDAEERVQVEAAIRAAANATVVSTDDPSFEWAAEQSSGPGLSPDAAAMAKQLSEMGRGV